MIIINHYSGSLYIVVHNREKLEIFQKSLLESMPKAAFQAWKSSLKRYRPFERLAKKF